MIKIIGLIAALLPSMAFAIGDGFSVKTCNIEHVQISVNGETLPQPELLEPVAIKSALVIEDDKMFHVVGEINERRIDYVSPPLKKGISGTLWGKRILTNKTIHYIKTDKGYGVSDEDGKWYYFKNCVDGSVES